MSKDGGSAAINISRTHLKLDVAPVERIVQKLFEQPIMLVVFIQGQRGHLSLLECPLQVDEYLRLQIHVIGLHLEGDEVLRLVEVAACAENLNPHQIDIESLSNLLRVIFLSPWESPGTKAVS